MPAETNLLSSVTARVAAIGAAARWRRIGLIAAGLLALVGVVGALAIPAVVRWGLETVASRELGRAVQVESIRANPYTLGVTLRGLTVASLPTEGAALLKVREMHVNASIGSLFRLAPVIDALSIDGLEANLVRLEPQRFNFSDIVDRLLAKPKTSDEPARFAVANIEVTASRIGFEDRVTDARHALDEIHLGIPFISNLPVDAEVKVQPAFAARLNGTPLEVKGETRPFHDTLESVIDLKLAALDIPKYLSYLPVKLNFVLGRGTLDTDLRVTFRRAAPASKERPAQAAQTVVSGQFAVNGLALAAPATNSAPLIAWSSLRVALDEVDPFARRAVIREIVLTAPEFQVERDAGGELNWLRFAQRPIIDASAASAAGATEAVAVAKPAATPFALTLHRAAVHQGSVRFIDHSAGRFEQDLVNLEVETAALTTTAPTRGTLKASAELKGNGNTALSGEVGLAPLAGRLKVSSKDVKMRVAARYLAHLIDGTLDGSSDLDGVLEFETRADGIQMALRDISIRGHDIKLTGPAGTDASFDLAGLSIDGGVLDLSARTLTINRLGLDRPRAVVKRMENGQLNWLRVIRSAPTLANSAAAPAAAVKSATPWTLTVAEVDVAGGDLRIEDLAVQPSVKLRAAPIAATVRNLVSDGTQPADLTLRARFASGGTAAVTGKAAWNPINANLRLDARSLDVTALRPYLAARLNTVLARAEFSARGGVNLSKADLDAPLQMAYAGNLRLANVHALDALGETDLLRWQTFEIDRIDFKAGAGAPTVALGTIALREFYARAIVSAQGRINLADLIKRDTPPPASTPVPASAAAPATETLAAAAAPNTRSAGPAGAAVASVAATAAPPGAAASAAQISIARIELERGNVNFTDNFIRPNYTANITGLAGSVSALASDSAEPATLSLTGKIDDEAPVEISGRLNPLAPKLFLDIEGRTKGVDLPRLTPYAVKYAGYPIAKGKLSMDVSYKLDDEKLNANNHLFIDQLTFGERVESPTATKLPVLLAVSLLTNSRGEIDLNLPVSGTLNDPQFSVGGIIIQVIVNLLTKVITAPFSLLAAAFGGGEELGYVEFTPGSATLAAAQDKRIDTLAKALGDRPALKLDIIGRVDPAADTEGVRRAKVDEKLRAAAVRQRVRSGSEAVDPSKVVVSEAQRPALIKLVYDDEKIPDKPRNFIGIATAIPVPEMERLIVANLAVTPEDLRALANQRATVVRNRLESDGKITRERLFLVEPKLTADGIKDKGAATRVDFSLK